MQLEQVNPAELMPADYNPRQINDLQMNALKRSLERWGFVEPVVVNKKTGHIVGGHQRVAAALELAIETVPVYRVDIDETDEKALNIALNKISGDWNADKLASLLSDLGSEGWDIADLGFGDDELHEIVQSWDDPADLDGVGDYDPNEDTVTLKITVPMHDAGSVVDALKEAITKHGWDYDVSSF